MILAFSNRKDPGHQTWRSGIDGWKGKLVDLKCPRISRIFFKVNSKVTFSINSCQILLPPPEMNFSSGLTHLAFWQQHIYTLLVDTSMPAWLFYSYLSHFSCTLSSSSQLSTSVSFPLLSTFPQTLCLEACLIIISGANTVSTHWWCSINGC